jgi:hypothetical protein
MQSNHGLPGRVGTVVVRSGVDFVMLGIYAIMINMGGGQCDE